MAESAENGEALGRELLRAASVGDVDALQAALRKGAEASYQARAYKEAVAPRSALCLARSSSDSAVQEHFCSRRSASCAVLPVCVCRCARNALRLRERRQLDCTARVVAFLSLSLSLSVSAPVLLFLLAFFLTVPSLLVRRMSAVHLYGFDGCERQRRRRSGISAVPRFDHPPLRSACRSPFPPPLRTPLTAAVCTAPRRRRKRDRAP